MSEKYLFLDIDGTLVNFDCTMPESTERALLAAQRNGHKLILCTGRCCGQIYPWMLERIPFDGIVSSSGARVKYHGREVYTKLFTKEQIAFLFDCFKKTGTSAYVHFDNTLAATEADAEGVFREFEAVGIARDAAESLLGKLSKVDSVITDGVERIVYCGSSLAHAEMRAMVGAEYTIDPYSYKGMPPTSGELNLSCVSKASGMKALLDHLGASVEDSIAFGDSWNDITVIRAAGYSVVMGNAPDGLKAEADYVTDRIDEDGIYNAFVKLGLI